MKQSLFIKSFICIALLFSSAVVFAQATRTWVSGVGDDVNPASRTAPCKTFAGAISKTAAGGEISVLDPGGYGSVTIVKSITIDGRGTQASILSSLTNGIIINAPDGIVIIRNLSINGGGNGINGIRILAAKQVVIEHCTLAGFTGKGIDISTTAACMVMLNDVSIHNAQDGISVMGPGSSVIIDNSRLQAVKGNGINVLDGQVIVNGSNISTCKTGINAAINTTVSIAGTVISNNETAFMSVSSIFSAGNNLVAGNKSLGMPPNVMKLQ